MNRINKIAYNLAQIVCGLGMFALILIFSVEKTWASMVPNDKGVGNGYVCEGYNVLQFVDNSQMQPGEKTGSTISYSLDLQNVSHIKFDLYEAYNFCCPSNKGKTTRSYTCQVTGASTASATNTSEMYLPNADWNEGILTISIDLENGAACPSCGHIMQIKYGISRIRVYRHLPQIRTQPENMQSCEGGNLTYSCQSDYATGYQWQVLSDGSYVNINDGVNSNGSIYSGAGSSSLGLSNVSYKDNGNIYRCVVLGVSNQSLASEEASLCVEGGNTPVTTPTLEPTQVPEPTPIVNPTPIITPDPTSVPQIKPQVTPSPVPTKKPENKPTPTATPVPQPTVTTTPVPVITVSPTINPTKVPIKPDNPTPNSPSTSSSSYIIYVPVIPEQTSTSSSSSSSWSDDNTSSSSSMVGKIYEDNPESDVDDYIGTIPGKSSSSDKSSSNHLSSSNKKNSLEDKRKDYSTIHNGASYRVNKSELNKTIMRNGILYIYDDDDSEENANEDEIVENVEEYELANSYTENDLMSRNEVILEKKDKKPDVGVYIGIGFAFIIGLLFLLFILFFGVIVEGECEEHDDVFDICGIRWVYRKDGNWCVRLGEVFEENAVVRLRLGLLFVLIFTDTELVGYVSGINEGKVSGEIIQKMLLYRKKIRRNAGE